MDHEFLLTNLDRLELNTIADGTAIGSAIGTGVNRLRDIEADSRILILMTDGQNNSGQIPPLTAAEAAEAMGVKIYTIRAGQDSSKGHFRSRKLCLYRCQHR
jgi:Ca-activated chloride channel family protein